MPKEGFLVDFFRYMASDVTNDIGLPIGLLIVRVDLTELWNTTLDIKAGTTGYAYLTNQEGQLIAYRDRNLTLEGNTPMT